MNRASLAIILGTLLGGGGGSTPRGARAEFPGRDLAQGSEESVSLVRGTALQVELDTPVDSKKVKTGDAVNAHVTEAVKANGQTVIPKNTKLVGHVTQASARAKGDAGSALAIVFDKVVPKKGQEVPLRVVIQAMAAAPRFTPDAGPIVAAINNGGAGSRRFTDETVPYLSSGRCVQDSQRYGETNEYGEWHRRRIGLRREAHIE
jgi:hypothetical protein